MPFRSSRAPARQRTVLAALFSLLPFAAAAQEPSAPPVDGPTLGAHTLLTHSEGMGVTPAVTAPIDTQQTGSSFIVINSGYAKNAGAPEDNYRNRWKRQGRTVVYNGYGDSFNVTAYVALTGKGGAGHTVRIDKSGYPEGEISVPFIEVANAGVLQDVVQNYPDPGLVLTSGNVTTTGPAVLVAVWWGDGAFKHMTTRPDNGFTLIDSYLMLPDNSGVQCAVAFKRVDAAGTYNVRWIGSPIQGAILWLFAFQAKPVSAH